MDVRFYRAASGRKPVGEYMRALDSRERAKLTEAFADLAEKGLEGSGVSRRHIQGKLWEVRVSAQRAFYVMVRGPVMVVLHAYKKEGQKAPPAEIATAISRMKEVLSGGE